MDRAARSAQKEDVALATSSEDGPARVSIARSPPCLASVPFVLIASSLRLLSSGQRSGRNRDCEYSFAFRSYSAMSCRRVRTWSSVQHCNASESSMNFAHHLVTISEQPPFAGSEHTSHSINFLFNTVGSNWQKIREPMHRRPGSPVCLLCACRSGTPCCHVDTAYINYLLSDTWK